MSTDRRHVAFNEGSDARIRGDGLSCNPYENESENYWYWDRGWRHVDSNWGVDVKKYTIFPLPSVVGSGFGWE